MDNQISGIHHVTAIAGDPQRNLDFYAGVLGLRLVKLTVNFDDPGTYHLYYGDYSGNPGTIVTFFPWRGIPQGRPGAGQMTVTSFSVPDGSFDFWKKRLSAHGVEAQEAEERFNERALYFHDYDGMALELVAASDARSGWTGGPIPDSAAIRGFHGATLSISRLEATSRVLAQTMGFEQVAREGSRYRFQLPGGGSNRIVDVIDTPPAQRGRQGAGSVHHIAWRVSGDAGQAAWRQTLIGTGLDVSPVMDRKYFHSIYYREPSGILFEIATDPPGFTVDEPLESLGQALVLPSWLESSRVQLLSVLPKLNLLQVQHA